MKTKVLFAGMAGLALLGALWLLNVYRHSEPVPQGPPQLPASTAEVIKLPTPVVNITNVTAAMLRDWPEDPRPSVQQLYHFAGVAHLFKFDPKITFYKEQKHTQIVEVGTPTHYAEFMNGRLTSVYSRRERLNSNVHYPEGMDEWYLGTGTWAEIEAVNETLDIMRRLNYAEMLKVVAVGRQEYFNGRVRANTPDGQTVTVNLFPTVRLYDAKNTLRVKAEFRMGTNGPVGLVDWSCY